MLLKLLRVQKDMQVNSGNFASYSMGSKNRISSKKFMQVEVDEIACAPSFVGMVSPVSEILSLVVFLQNCIWTTGSKNKIGSKIHASRS